MLTAKNQGYGISGAINVYNEKSIRVGNWVEDAIGAKLAMDDRSKPREFETEYSFQHRPIEQRPPISDGGIVTPSVRDLKVKNKDGLPYTLVFKHGKDDIPLNERFTTMVRVASSDSVASFNLPERSLEKQKARQIKADFAAAYDKTTTARTANSFVADMKTNTIPNMAIGRSENLPVWSRRNVFTQHEK